ncbi:hypothetical protein NMY22_g10529 [Coprinellus aureogranulatus]|nr:hypothetical protein NMY22_g10529 [Coprinellus aureogranulatus]
MNSVPAQSKAAVTRARNAELRRQADARLIEEIEASGGREAKRKAGEGTPFGSTSSLARFKVFVAWARMIPGSRQSTSQPKARRGATQQGQRDDGRRVGGSDSKGKKRRLRKSEGKVPRAPDLEDDAPSEEGEESAVEEETQPRKRRKSDQELHDEEVESDQEVEDEMAGEDDEENESQSDGEDGPLSSEMLEIERPSVVTHRTAPKLRGHKRRSSVIEDSEDGGGEEEEGDNPGKNSHDYEDDVEMASQSRAPSRAATLPPPTRSECDALFLSDDEDDFESRRAPRKTLRDITFNSERPQIQRSKNASTAQGRTSKRVSSAPPGNRRNQKQNSTLGVVDLVSEEDTNGKYPEHAILRPRLDGKSGILLRDQHPLLKRVVDRAISQVTRDMVLDCAWPEAAARNQYGRTKLLSACAHVARTYPQAADIEDRVKEDVKFAKVLIEQIVDRLATHRHKAAKYAHSQVSFFKLGLGEECRERVGIVSSMHAYIFPGRWTGADHKAWDSVRREPYLNPAIIETLKSAYFGSEQAIGYRFKEDFKVLYNGETRYEIPPSLLALAATAVYHSLQEYRTGTHMEIPFHGNVFFPTYKSHIRTLQQLEQERPSRYHEILRRVYELVAIHGNHHEASEEQDAFKLIDID